MCAGFRAGAEEVEVQNMKFLRYMRKKAV